ncbi:MAG: glycosyltransferase [Ferruginibacter sp.]
MTIAVHIAAPVIQNGTSTNFNYKCFTLLAQSHPKVHFIFIFDQPFPASAITEKNITPVLAGPQVKNRMLQYYFYNFKIPRLLNKYNVDHFVSTEVCSLRTNVPQLLIIKDLSFLKKNNLLKRADSSYLKRYTKFFVKRSARIAVLNPTLKTTLLKTFAVADDKINIINAAVDTGNSLTYEKTEAIKNNYTEGKEYFLFFSTPSTVVNTITMLKAFSIFKKWQRSNMQLLILFASNEKNTIKDLSSYKYKADVKTLNATSLEMSRELIAAAYAAIHLPAVELTEGEGLNCLASSIPLITTGTDFYRNIYHESALYSQPAEKDIAEKMMLLYKDENTRNELIQKGNAVISADSWQNVADSLFHTIQPLTAV